MEEEILQAIRYFSFFNYVPTTDEIYAFLKKKALKRHFTGILEKMVEKGILARISNRIHSPRLNKYTLGEYSIKAKISQEKIDKIKPYIKLLSHFPQIKLIGLSGTVAMMNAEKDDDIDLFIITAKNRLFTGRFISIIIGYVLGVRRKYGEEEAKDKVCLNLFFDEKDMKITKKKQTEYVAHEVLQMKPLVVKGDVYERFLKVNDWVFDIFPNAHSASVILSKRSASKDPLIKRFNKGFLGRLGMTKKVENIAEHLLKNLQLYFIRKHQTKELITDHQLWFHPEDFGEKMMV